MENSIDLQKLISKIEIENNFSINSYPEKSDNIKNANDNMQCESIPRCCKKDSPDSRIKKIKSISLVILDKNLMIL